MRLIGGGENGQSGIRRRHNQFNHSFIQFKPSKSAMAERAGFEPAIPQRDIPVFETGAFNHSATSPQGTRRNVISAGRGAPEWRYGPATRLHRAGGGYYTTLTHLAQRWIPAAAGMTEIELSNRKCCRDRWALPHMDS